MAGQARFEIEVYFEGEEIRESVKTRREVLEYAREFMGTPGYRVRVFDRVTDKELDLKEILE